MASGFDDIFAEITSMNAEQVLISERVKMLEEQLSATTSSGGGKADGEEKRPVGAPVCWKDLSAQDQALWPEFVTWVIWLADRYEMVTDQLPRQCWWKHGAVVEELTALWTSHQSAYASDEDGGSAPYLWQDALSRAIERIGRHWLGPCRNGQHKERHREAWGGDEDYLQELLAASPPMTGEGGDEAGEGDESTTGASPGTGETDGTEAPPGKGSRDDDNPPSD